MYTRYNKRTTRSSSADQSHDRESLHFITAEPLLLHILYSTGLSQLSPAFDAVTGSVFCTLAGRHGVAREMSYGENRSRLKAPKLESTSLWRHLAKVRRVLQQQLLYSYLHSCVSPRDNKVHVRGSESCIARLHVQGTRYGLA